MASFSGGTAMIQNVTIVFSQRNTTFDVNVWKERRSRDLMRLLLPNTIMLMILLILGFLGNSIILYFYNCRIKSSKEQRNRDFITYLALTDLGVCVLGCSLGIALNFHPLDFDYDFVCRSMWFVTGVSVYSSGLLLTVIALHRFLMICRPLGQQMTLKRKRIAVLCVLLGGAVLSLPSLFLFGTHEFVTTIGIRGYTCGKLMNNNLRAAQTYYDIVVCVAGLIALATTMILYCFVGKVIYKRLRNRRKSRAHVTRMLNGAQVMDTSCSDDKELSSQNSKNQSKELLCNSRSDLSSNLNIASEQNIERKKTPDWKKLSSNFRFSFMFILISIMYVISYSPRTYISFREGLEEDFWNISSDEEIVVYLFLYRMYIINSVSNPIIYGLFDRRLREEIWKCLPRSLQQ